MVKNDKFMQGELEKMKQEIQNSLQACVDDNLTSLLEGVDVAIKSFKIYLTCYQCGNL